MERELFYRLVQIATQTIVLLDSEPIPYPLLVSSRTGLLMFGGAYREFTTAYPHLKEQADFVSDTIGEIKDKNIDIETALKRLHEALLNYEANRSGG